MLTGIVNQDSLPQLLQSIAQRRKQGDLEITLTEITVKLSFIQGKIFEYKEGDSSPLLEIVAILKAAGAIGTDLAFEGKTYADLQQFVQAAGGVTGQNALRMAVHKRLLDKLHQFTIEGTVPWGFRVGGVDVDRAVSSGVSVSQLLLDWAEIGAARDLFIEAFPSDEIELERQIPTLSNPTVQRAAIWDVLETSLPLRVLKEKVLLDAMQFMLASVELLNDGSVKLKQVAVAPQATKETPQEDVAENEAEVAEPAKAVEAPKVKPRKVKIPRKVESDVDFIPHVVALVILIASVVLPFFFWRDAFTLF